MLGNDAYVCKNSVERSNTLKGTKTLVTYINSEAMRLISRGKMLSEEENIKICYKTNLGESVSPAKEKIIRFNHTVIRMWLNIRIHTCSVAYHNTTSILLSFHLDNCETCMFMYTMKHAYLCIRKITEA